MFNTDDRDHHRDRVRAELDLAYRADCRAAADAHLRLSALHMHRLAELDGSRAVETAPQPAAPQLA